MAIGIKNNCFVLLFGVLAIKDAAHQGAALVAIHHRGEFAARTHLGNQAGGQGPHGAGHAGMEAGILAQDGS